MQVCIQLKIISTIQLQNIIYFIYKIVSSLHKFNSKFSKKYCFHILLLQFCIFTVFIIIIINNPMCSLETVAWNSASYLY
jgi:hypothetical protein